MSRKWLINGPFPMLLIVLIFSACARSGSADAGTAKQTLTSFFNYINKGEYSQAAMLYGGSYEMMASQNPDIAPNNVEALWQNACTINGLQCLPVRTVTLKERKGDEFTFMVEFNTPDGKLFVRGPCCGATEIEQPPVSKFEFAVQKMPDGQFKVLTAPVYVP
jgi:hypothetical protein